jgi:hypothetical protein
MTAKPRPTVAHAEPLVTEMELELHASVEGLQVQVRALATAVDHLCRALEATTADLATSSEVARAVEEARWSLRETW